MSTCAEFLSSTVSVTGLRLICQVSGTTGPESTVTNLGAEEGRSWRSLCLPLIVEGLPNGGPGGHTGAETEKRTEERGG